MATTKDTQLAKRLADALSSSIFEKTSQAVCKSNRELIAMATEAGDWIECAKRDLDASKCLYDKNDYANSVYHLQQAVEKTTKGLGLITGLLTIEELESVRHKSPKAFVLMLDKKWEDILRIIKPIRECYPNLKIATDTAVLEDLIKTREEELARISEIEIHKFLEPMETLEKGLREL